MPLPMDHLDAITGVSVRQSVKAVSNAYPYQTTYGYPNKHYDVTATGNKIPAMPLPVIKDPKSGLTDQESKTKSTPTTDPKNQLGAYKEDQDLSGITYGNQKKISTPHPELMGLQRVIPSAYSETTTKEPWLSFDGIKFILVDGEQIRNQTDPDFVLGGNHGRYDWIPSNEIWIDKGQDPAGYLPTAVHEYSELTAMETYGCDYEDAHENYALPLESYIRNHEKQSPIETMRLIQGILEEFEHTDSIQEAEKIATDHLKERDDYYAVLKTAMEHTEIEMKTSDLTLPAQGIGISQDKTILQIPATNIKADVRGELQMKRDQPVYNEDNDDEDPSVDESWVAAFKAGSHTDSEGNLHKWEPKDVEKIAQQYNKSVDPKNPERRVAPVVVGHPKDNSPAFGWISKAKAVGDKLYLKLSELQPEFVTALKKGLYKTRSISLYPDLNIRHLGFLGGSQPAVAGLGPFQFQEQNYTSYEYTEEDDSMNEIEAIKKENSFFKKLFSMFKLETNSFKEGTSSDLPSQEVPQIETINNKYPKGATMSENKMLISKTDHRKYAQSYLEKAKSYIEGKSGEDISATTEFLKLAHMHAEAACDEPDGDEEFAANKIVKEVREDLKGTPGPQETYKKIAQVLTHLEKATVSGNLVQPAEMGCHSEAIATTTTAETAATVTPAAVEAVKTEPNKEFVEMKAEFDKLKADNDRLTKELAAKQASAVEVEFRSFCEALVSEGRMKPVQVEMEILNLKSRDEMDKKETTDFSEKKLTRTRNYVQEYKDYLCAMPKVLEFGEILTGTAPKQPSTHDFVEAEIKKVMTSNPGMQYHQALNKVAEVEPEKVSAYIQNSFN